MCREYHNVAPGDTEQTCTRAAALIACDCGHSEQEVASYLDVITVDPPAEWKVGFSQISSLLSLHSYKKNESFHGQKVWLVGVCVWKCK